MHARAISSRAVASVSPFPSRGSKNLWLSVEAFSRGVATRLSHDVYPLGCLKCHRVVSRPWLESRGSAGKPVSLLWTEHLGDSGNGGRPWSSSRLSCGERLLLRCDGTPGILSRPRCAGFCTDMSFQLLWVTAKEHDCWIVFQSGCTILHSNQQ